MCSYCLQGAVSPVLFLQRTCEGHPFLHRERFRPPPGIYSHFLQRLSASRLPAESAAKHFSLLREGNFREREYFFQRCIIRQRFAEAFNVQHRRVHLWRRQESFWWNSDEHFRSTEKADEDCEESCMFRVADFLCDSLLYEERKRVRMYCRFQEDMPQERRSDVVGDIRHDFVRFFRHRDPEGVALDHSELRIGFQICLEQRDEAVIQLHRSDFRGSGEEFLREHADAGSDLHDTVLRPDLRSLHDGLEHFCIHEKMLPEVRIEPEGIGAAELPYFLFQTWHGHSLTFRFREVKCTQS